MQQRGKTMTLDPVGARSPPPGSRSAVGAALLVHPPLAAQAAAATDTAWHSGAFNVDRPNLVRRSNIILGRPNTSDPAVDAARQRQPRRRRVGRGRLHRPAQPQ